MMKQHVCPEIEQLIIASTFIQPPTSFTRYKLSTNVTILPSIRIAGMKNSLKDWTLENETIKMVSNSTC